MIALIAMYALFGVVLPISKIAIKYASPLFLTGSRMVVGGLALLIYCAIQDWKKFASSCKLTRSLLIVSFFGIYATSSLEFWGLQYINAAKAAFLYNTSPLFVALFSYLLFSETMTYKKCLGFCIAFLGLIPILLLHEPNDLMPSIWYGVTKADLAILVGSCCMAYGWTVMKKLITVEKYPIVLANALSMIIGGVLCFVTSLYMENWTPVPVFNWQSFMWSALLIMCISNIIGYISYTYFLKKYTATFLSMASFLVPLFAALYSVLFLKEKIGWHFFISMVMVVSGLSLFYLEEIKQGYIKT